MNKRIFICVAIVLAVIVIVALSIIMYFHTNKQPDIMEFDMIDYQWEIENFSFEGNVGPIDDANTAVEKAKDLWLEKYSTVNGQPYDPIKRRKFEVLFDSNNDCWLIKSVSNSNVKASTPHAMIQKDGKVIAVWMG